MNFKNISLFFPLLILCFLISGCETKKTELPSVSPDGKTQITVYGTKTFMEPWDLVLEIKSGDKSNKLETQLYADEITQKNIIFAWQDNSTCVITLIAQDDSQRTIEISI